jgi:hypothetical protein
MKYQISNVSVGHTAKVFAVLYAIFGTIAALFGSAMLLIGDNRPDANFTGVMYLLSPIINAVAGFISGALGAWVYNIVAKKIGGIELILEQMPTQSDFIAPKTLENQAPSEGHEAT